MRGALLRDLGPDVRVVGLLMVDNFLLDSLEQPVQILVENSAESWRGDADSRVPVTGQPSLRRRGLPCNFGTFNYVKIPLE